MKTLAEVTYEKDTRGRASSVLIDIQNSTREEVQELIDEIFANRNVDGQIEQSPYNPEFVAKIKQSEKDFKEGNYTTRTIEDLWK
ncbi:hypothetical protein AGMMS49965_01550 [Bacteroidia bacterium]|nr:hypothetical protein AGMMS49965_01550 [Bacteroidia bacterium]